MFIIFWKFLMADQIFFSPQVKRRVPISNKLVLPHELPSELKLRILGNRKYQENLHWTITPQPNPAPNKKPKTPPAPANPPAQKKKNRHRATPHEKKRPPQIPRGRLPAPNIAPNFSRHPLRTPIPIKHSVQSSDINQILDGSFHIPGFLVKSLIYKT